MKSRPNAALLVAASLVAIAFAGAACVRGSARQPALAAPRATTQSDVGTSPPPLASAAARGDSVAIDGSPKAASRRDADLAPSNSENGAADPLPLRPQKEGMAYVPGGEFTMGIDSGGEEDEHPAHRVHVDGFYLDVLEVTVENYLQCVKAGACRMYREDAAKSFRAGDDASFRRPQQPISGVAWDDAVAYCAFVGKRLPREAEWERAASGDDRRRYVWGNESPDPKRHGCFMRAVGPKGQTTCDVGSFPDGKGPYGHLDLAGNVWEWTADDYDPYAYRRATAGVGQPGSCEQILAAQNEIRESGRRGFTGSNPVPTTCEKVLRGGAFNYPGPGLRVTNRVHHPAGWRMLVAGFRCAIDAPQELAQGTPR